MKKTFRKSIACLLAILMIVFSMPFSVFAGVAVNPEKSQYHTQWWDTVPTAESDYVGYNSDKMNELWGDTENTGGWCFEAGSTIDLESEDEVEDLLDEYKPQFFVTVSDYSSKDAKVYGTGDKVASTEATIKNPSELKAGDKIAVTIEAGGFDSVFQILAKGIVKTDYLQAAYWKTAKGKTTWTKSTASGGAAANGVLAQNSDIGYKGMGSLSSNYDVETGEFASSVGSNYMGSNLSVYCGKDVRPYGDNGIIVVTMTFEVLKDCSLADAIDWMPLGDGGAYCMPYAGDKIKAVRPYTANSNGTVEYNYCFEDPGVEYKTGSMQTVYGQLAPTCYVGATASVTHTHSFEGAVPVNNQDGTHTITCTAADCDKSDGYQVTSACTSFSSQITKPATCNEAGETTYTCNDCGYQLVKAEPAATGNHDYTKLTTVVEGENGTHKVSCATCGTEKETVPCTFEVEHTTLPTTTSTGLDTYTCACGNTYTKVVDKTPHDHTGGVATCQAKAVCDICGEEYGELDLNNHTNPVTDAATDSTCQAAGKTEGSHCADCGRTIVAQEDKPLAEHDYSVVKSEKVEASYVAAGKEAVMGCKWCDATIGGEEIPMLIGKQITVTPAANGTVTANGNAVAEAVTLNIEPNTVVALTATPAEGFAFVGWSVDGEIVSTDANYNLVAIADAAVTPVFEEIAKEFTVTFLDFAGNVLSAQTVTDAAAVVIPDAPEMPGYNFVAWSHTADQIAALTEDTTVTPIYEEIPVQTGYTVIADGCTITINGEDIADKATGLEFNTLVTVKADGAKAWAVNGSNVAFGDTYTFYLGSDITVVPVFEDVVAAPAVQAVSMNRVEGSHKVAFLATASAPEGVDVVAVGYIYGKNLTEADLTLDKIGQKGAADNAGVVKQAQCAANYEQFSLLYGLTAKQGTASARAYLIYNNANGEQVTIYAPVQSYTY